MENFKIIIFILVVLISLSALIDKLRLPNPVFLVLVGLIIGFVPVLPDLVMDPNVVFLVFLPPLLYDAAFRTSWHEFKTNIKPISALGISLVFITTLAIAVTAHYFIPVFSWPLAFLLGAIISPPDAVAATGIIKGLGLNTKVISILEGESLVNDASALIAYRYALVASITGSFLLWEAGLQFLYVAGVGIIMGLLIGFVLIFIHKRIVNQSIVETSLTLLTPFMSYLAAEQIHASGILAVVSTGLLLAWRSPEIFSYQTRIRTRVVWDTLMFLLNGFVFILIGLQLPGILKQLTDYSLSALIGYGLIVSVVTILVRMIWVFGGVYLFRMFNRDKGNSNGVPADQERFGDWKNVLIVAWTGTRGVISMALALALPLNLYNGNTFLQRHLIVFVCFVVVFVTLVVQGFSLPLLIRLLDVKPVISEDKEEKELQLYIVNSTMHFIDYEFYPQPPERTRIELKKKFEQVAAKLVNEINIHTRNESEEEQVAVRTLTDMQKAQLEIGRFQRELLLKLHKEGRFSDAAIRTVERDMDIAELKLNQSLPKKDE
ncbi:Na+/H+ antiporter [Niastella yeongjuensis]|uniref:Na+/H+ antiporter n=1 Tax=Niastella yeongjuensis TaxID=354355 RepID=A0A1V9F378_9BACT|nr:Na+/H+ antiporter [Niastella yeongjuensis]OQP52873.1 Na+/H+ antiporter [Niastella yeongjuensis]SEP21509.1 monovalent cation:H+ antiporter, CPA1 family [Niastella yeongjuensis]